MSLKLCGLHVGLCRCALVCMAHPGACVYAGVRHALSVRGGRAPGASVDFLTQGLQAALALLARGTDGGAIFRSRRVRERASAPAHTRVWGRGAEGRRRVLCDRGGALAPAQPENLSGLSLAATISRAVSDDRLSPGGTLRCPPLPGRGTEMPWHDVWLDARNHCL